MNCATLYCRLNFSRGANPSQGLLDQALNYLDKVRASAVSNSARDVVPATELANTYKDIGMLFEPSSHDRALVAYGNAAQVIQAVSDTDPDHGANHEQWAWIRARIKTLGGNVPVYIAHNAVVLTPVTAGADFNQVTKANYIRINIALESARRAIDRGDLAAARENIGIANEFARRVLSVVGR